MRRRFGRRRWRGAGGGEGGAARPGVDPAFLARIAASGLVDVPALEPVRHEDVPDWLCALGAGVSAGGERRVVAFSPASGTAALLGALVAGLRGGAGGGRLRAVAVAPHWREVDRRLLGLLAGLPFELTALAAPALGDDPAVEPEGAAPRFVPADLIGAAFDAAPQRALFERALAGLRGLAAKHGGVVRGAEGAAELVLLARPVAALRATPGGPALEVLEPSRSGAQLAGEELAEALDRLEGQLRRFLSDRRILEGDAGLRGAGWEVLAAAVGARHVCPWPLAGEDCEALDFAAVDPSGTPLVGALRRRLDLGALAAILEAALRAEPALAAILSDVGPPLRLGAPGLALAAGETSPAVDAVLAHLRLAVRGFAAREVAGRVELAARALATAEPSTATAAGPRVAPAATPAPAAAPPAYSPPVVAAAPAFAPAPAAAAPAAEPATFSVLDLADEADESEGARGADALGSEGPSAEGAGRRRRRRRGRRRGGEGEAERAPRPAEEPAPEAAARPYLEVSLFDLDEEPGSGDESRGRRRRRRGGRRGRRDGDDARDDDDEPAAPGTPRAAAPAADDAEDDEDGEALLELSDAPELEEPEVPAYEEGDLEEAPLSETERLRLERERRRRARLAAAAPVLHPEHGGEAAAPGAAPEAAAAPELPRGRAAVLAHADRASIASAVLLAREMRSVEGIWIYPQADLMTFFRGVATDLRANTPIFVVGFEPKPAHDAIQAASLYAGRLVWFDHREWPPEDLHAMRRAIGAGMLHVTPGSESPLAAVLTLCTRRSRFSDKLVDLVNGRFSVHDWERWGRLWWHRLGELAKRVGDHRPDVEPLLVGRPSELAREAARVPVPPPPPEVEFAASRDFALVHFGGYGLVRVELPPELDVGLAARIVRERFGAALSLARRQGSETFTLGASDNGVRALDVAAMVDHLAEKLEWVQALSDADHVARFRIRDLERRPERADEVVAEIGMSRGVLEG